MFIDPLLKIEQYIYVSYIGKEIINRIRSIRINNDDGLLSQEER